jgi:hypothetical protein
MTIPSHPFEVLVNNPRRENSDERVLLARYRNGHDRELAPEHYKRVQIERGHKRKNLSTTTPPPKQFHYRVSEEITCVVLIVCAVVAVAVGACLLFIAAALFARERRGYLR